MAEVTVLKRKPSRQPKFDAAQAQCNEDGAVLVWTILAEKRGQMVPIGRALETDYGEILFQTTVPAGSRIMLVHANTWSGYQDTEDAEHGVR
ncbi:MAG: hypothetical protein INF48_07230 [Rhodobacter sp.]|nr:hypothetical protein [Rhodobacter sp.]